MLEKEERTMPKKISEEEPKIYVTPRGARYVKADEVLRRPKVKEAIKKIAKISAPRKSADTFSKEH